jgi:exosortase/archaeosortase family protein
MRTNEVVKLTGRYVALLLLGLFKLKLFVLIFTPLTVYPVFWALSLVDSSARMLENNLFFFSGIYAQIIPACVAGAAYYLLLILNLTTPMETKQRIKSIALLVGTFLILNVVRILIFIAIAVEGMHYFDSAHNFVWYFGSTVLVVLIWFFNVWLLKIRDIPIYSDMNVVFSEITRKKGKRKNRKALHRQSKE